MVVSQRWRSLPGNFAPRTLGASGIGGRDSRVRVENLECLWKQEKRRGRSASVRMLKRRGLPLDTYPGVDFVHTEPRVKVGQGREGRSDLPVGNARHLVQLLRLSHGELASHAHPSYSTRGLWADAGGVVRVVYLNRNVVSLGVKLRGEQASRGGSIDICEPEPETDHDLVLVRVAPENRWRNRGVLVRLLSTSASFEAAVCAHR